MFERHRSVLENFPTVLCLAVSLVALTVLAGCPGQIGEPDDDDTTSGEIEGDEAGECDDSVDNDQDGFADCEDSGCADATMCADADGDGWSIQAGDCDDTDPAVHPGADEAPCDEVDNDCDPATGDESDDDGDGYTACEECDDGDPDVNPDASEVTCDGVDNDCDPDTEDAPDGDGDGWSLCEDCDDGDPDVSPGAEEQACDGVDNDCDPTTEDETDGDGDGHSSCTDCDDGNADVYPGAYEECDGLDTDCDGSIPLGELDNDGDGYVACGGPMGDADCDDLDPNVYPGATELCDGADGDCDGQLPGDEADVDADGWMECDGDCDDVDPLQYPGADEYCNAEDDDCDGTVDEDESLDVAVWFEDGDGDGFGDPASTDVDCEQPPGFADNSLDCDDGDPAIHPDAEDIACDGMDNDCDPATPDGEDADGDGHDECSDCDESDGETYPGATEVCDGEDNDCDGAVPADEGDDDGDGWWACDGDCDDTDPTTYPGAPELCDNLDNDCDGTQDEGVADDLDGDGYTPCDGDCDDGDGDSYPGAPEICDGADSDCDGTLPGDEEDGDGDGMPPCAGDCDDAEPTVYLGAPDLCDAHLDNDCDGAVDPREEDDDGDGTTECDGDCDDEDAGMNPDDADGDGWATCDGDCDDGDTLVHPGMAEDCGDGVDNDCDGAVDDCGPGGIVDLSQADAKLLGQAEWDHAADFHSLWRGGDIDGDGVDDILVGAVYNDNGAGNGAGATYVLYGPVYGTVSLSYADAILTGETLGDVSGYAVAGGGDVNADGYGDILVGANGQDAGGDMSGAAYLIHGPVYGTVSLSTADAKFVGESTWDQAGVAAKLDGDVNGDGHYDVVVGAHNNDEGGGDAGAAYLLYGPLTGTIDLSTADAKFIGEAAGDLAGYGLSISGDADADGNHDVLVGAYENDDGGTDAGKAYLFYAPVYGPTDLSAADAEFLGESWGDRAGAATEFAGDVNGDGYDDLIIGANQSDRGGADSGAAYVFHGPVYGSHELSTANTVIVGEEAGDAAGRMVASAGDMDQDGFGDLLIGAHGSDRGGSDAGAAYLLYGPLAGEMDLYNADVIFVGEEIDDWTGYNLAADVDLDGNGWLDLGIACPKGDQGYNAAGGAYVIYNSQ